MDFTDWSALHKTEMKNALNVKGLESFIPTMVTLLEIFQKATKKEPLTYYDMNLSAPDHQTFFTCEADAGKTFLNPSNALAVLVIPRMMLGITFFKILLNIAKY